MNKEVWIDGQGGVYSTDRKRLLKVPDVKRYRIEEGCEETDEQPSMTARHWKVCMSQSRGKIRALETSSIICPLRLIISVIGTGHTSMKSLT
jgi:hypothetical protein